MPYLGGSLSRGECIFPVPTRGPHANQTLWTRVENMFMDVDELDGGAQPFFHLLNCPGQHATTRGRADYLKNMQISFVTDCCGVNFLDSGNHHGFPPVWVRSSSPAFS